MEAGYRYDDVQGIRNAHLFSRDIIDFEDGPGHAG
jgi:hypothetical protein